jgi:hypothetical protein
MTEPSQLENQGLHHETLHEYASFAEQFAAELTLLTN